MAHMWSCLVVFQMLHSHIFVNYLDWEAAYTPTSCTGYVITHMQVPGLERRENSYAASVAKLINGAEPQIGTLSFVLITDLFC